MSGPERSLACLRTPSRHVHLNCHSRPGRLVASTCRVQPYLVSRLATRIVEPCEVLPRTTRVLRAMLGGQTAELYPRLFYTIQPLNLKPPIEPCPLVLRPANQHAV